VLSVGRQNSCVSHSERRTRVDGIRQVLASAERASRFIARRALLCRLLIDLQDTHRARLTPQSNETTTGKAVQTLGYACCSGLDRPCLSHDQAPDRPRRSRPTRVRDSSVDAGATARQVSTPGTDALRARHLQLPRVAVAPIFARDGALFTTPQQTQTQQLSVGRGKTQTQTARSTSTFSQSLPTPRPSERAARQSTPGA
jgi:hypothetical protein